MLPEDWMILCFFRVHRRGAESAEIKFFSFVAETPTNENPQPLRGRINLFKLKHVYECTSFDLAIWFDGIKLRSYPEGLGLFLFVLSTKRNKKKYPLRSLRLERSGR